MMSPLSKIKQYWKKQTTKYGRLISPTAFGAGFVLDLFTLNRIDQQFDLMILLIHTALATFWIFLWHFQISQRAWIKKRTFIRKVAQKIAPPAMQFSFGALFSGFVIFYTKSSSLFVSWPFLILLYGLFLGNETFRKFYRGLYFQMGVFYFSIFTLLIFLVPLSIHKIGFGPFLLSGFVSIILIGSVFFFFFKILQSITKKEHFLLWLSVMTIWMGMNALYLQNLIPAIPLSLKTDGIYHKIERTSTGYISTKEKKMFWEYVIPQENIQKTPGQNVYYFSSVFAPSKFKEPIVHDWQKWNEDTQTWRSIYDHTINITGGRDGGYRGYTYLINPSHGKWKVLVRTPKGQILGQKIFSIIPHKKYRPKTYKAL